MIDICEIAQVQLSKAYIVSPSYPANIVGGVKCECQFKSNSKDGQILLRRLDLKVFWFLLIGFFLNISLWVIFKLPGNKNNELCNEAFLDIIENNKRSEKKCGYTRETGSIFGSGANELKFVFSTGEQQSWNDKGFWLELQGVLQLILK